MSWHPDLAMDALARLRRYAFARDRTIDREPRTITLSDDEAAALVQYVTALEAGET